MLFRNLTLQTSVKHLSKTDAQLDIWIFSGPETELGMGGRGYLQTKSWPNLPSPVGFCSGQELLRGRVHAELTAAAQVGLLRKNLLHP